LGGLQSKGKIKGRGLTGIELCHADTHTHTHS
jgi:hypothetical protein